MPAQKQVEVEGRELSLTNLGKVLYPKAGFTKGQVIDYYARIGPAILPHLAGRAVTLHRFPEGTDQPDKAFFEKRCPKHRPSWVRTATVVAGPRAGAIDFCVCRDLPTLIWLAQLGTLELHPSLSLARAPERPTVLVFDLDPGEPADILDCCRVALRLCEILGALELKCFAKTSGSKGLQVYAPLNSATSYDETKPFARAIAQLLEKQTPGEVLSKMSKELRRGKVFIDWSQNHQRKTTICVYSLRARERPTVSTPIGWDEVEGALKNGDAARLSFEAPQVLERFERHGDLFAGVLELRQRMPRFEQVGT